MLRVVLRHEGGKMVVVLGLSEENLKRLADDKPILMSLRQVDPDEPPDMDMPDIDFIVALDGEALSNFLLGMNVKPSSSNPNDN
jgi:hypothetical protein